MTVQELLDDVRRKRNFDAETYIKNKVRAINDFFREEGLDSVVLGISGGIDSAVAFYLYNLAKEEHDSPINEVMPISMPIRDSVGVTGQNMAASMAQLVVESLDYTYYEVDLALSSYYISHLSCDIFENKAWAIGQMNSVLRTPVLYFHAAILQTAGKKSIVSGTTNRDEGSFIGFFGKASDGMVDLQPIADIHKSEVYAVAKKLGIPSIVSHSVPKGDVWDNKNDEDMIGTSYDMVELITSLRVTESFPDALLKIHDNREELEKFLTASYAVHEIHRINAHKYRVGSPARFIDVMERKVPGGWQ